MGTYDEIKVNAFHQHVGGDQDTVLVVALNNGRIVANAGERCGVGEGDVFVDAVDQSNSPRLLISDLFSLIRFCDRLKK